MPEHMRGNHVLWCDRQDVERHAFRMLCRKCIETSGKGVQIRTRLWLQQTLIIALDRIPEPQPLDEVIGDRSVPAEVARRSAAIVGEGFLEYFPTVLRLSPCQTKSHVGVGLAIDVGHAQRISLN